MKITSLRPLMSSGGRSDAPAGDASIRGTEAQDMAVEATPDRRAQLIRYGAIAGGALVVLAFVMLIRAWSASEYTVSRERLRIATVTEGPFVRDVSAQGTVVAAVSPTLFAVAPGNISYLVRAGDAVEAGQPLAMLVSPALENEYQRERATLESLDTALARQRIEIRRQQLRSQEEMDLADVQIRAAERELQRAQSAWDKGAIPERDLRRAQDERESARLAYEHARETAGLERESLDLDLRTRRLERDRQALTVANLRRRVDELTVRAPVGGIVANLAAAERANVAENAPLLTVVDLSAFEVEFQVADVYARDIKPGMEAQISLDGSEHAGIVTAISPEVRSGQVTGRVKFQAQPAGLRQSQRSSVRIVIEQRAMARKFERSSDITSATRAVHVVDGDRAVLRPVTLGAASVGEIEVIDGLKPGDQVVVSGISDLRDVPEIMIGG
ncbi:MAG: efflux RND transporter periplasmic adaptor subunit [Steroidobacteraceae bacterium]|nr:efflux RND transporter periplasmic adaptor subunit [Steroidobacteraceae bacterium]